MKSNLIISFIYRLVDSGIRVWVEENKVKISLPEFVVLNEEDKSFLKGGGE